MGRMRGAEAAEAKRFFGRLCECRNTNGSPVRACCALVCVSLSLLVLEAFFIKRSKRCLCLVCVCVRVSVSVLCVCVCRVSSCFQVAFFFFDWSSQEENLTVRLSAVTRIRPRS